MPSYVWHDGTYIHSCLGRDASVSSFLCAIGLYHVCQMTCSYTDVLNCILPTLDKLIHMYSRDASIHLCATMVHICIHIHGKMHSLSHACVWQDSFINVTMNHAHVSDDPDTHIEYYSVKNSPMEDIHAPFFIMSNPYAGIYKRHIVHMPICFYINRKDKFKVMCLYACTCRSRERWNVWPVTFIHMYICDACIHTCDMMVHVYIHVFGRDASVAHSCVQ